MSLPFPTIAGPVPHPKVVGLCGKLTLDGRASSGTASRIPSATWSVSVFSDMDESAVLTTVESALAPFQGTLLATLDATALEIGVEFLFTLTVGNFFGAEDKATVAVTRM